MIINSEEMTPAPADQEKNIKNAAEDNMPLFLP